jgi:anti-anti-sigma factor
MNISIQSLSDIVVVTIDGVVDSMSAGQIYDALLAQISAGAQKIVIEFTDTVVLNRAGIRGLIVASKILRNRRGQMRICGAKPQDEQFLNSVSFRHLLTFDRDRASSIFAMAESREVTSHGNHLLTSAKAA